MRGANVTCAGSGTISGSTWPREGWLRNLKRIWLKQNRYPSNLRAMATKGDQVRGILGLARSPNSCRTSGTTDPYADPVSRLSPLSARGPHFSFALPGVAVSRRQCPTTYAGLSEGPRPVQAARSEGSPAFQLLFGGEPSPPFPFFPLAQTPGDTPQRPVRFPTLPTRRTGSFYSRSYHRLPGCRCLALAVFYSSKHHKHRRLNHDS
jgi:hypothetical protein